MGETRIEITDKPIKQREFSRGSLIRHKTTGVRGFVTKYIVSPDKDNNYVRVMAFFIGGPDETSWLESDIEHWTGTITISNE